MIDLKETKSKTVFLSTEVSPLVFDLYSTLNEIKSMEEVESIYMNVSEYKLEIYIYYLEENFEIEDKIIKKITDFESSYKYFPEVFIYPLNMIEGKKITLPNEAKEF